MQSYQGKHAIRTQKSRRGQAGKRKTKKENEFCKWNTSTRDYKNPRAIVIGHETDSVIGRQFGHSRVIYSHEIWFIHKVSLRRVVFRQMTRVFAF